MKCILCGCELEIHAGGYCYKGHCIPCVDGALSSALLRQQSQAVVGEQLTQGDISRLRSFLDREEEKERGKKEINPPLGVDLASPEEKTSSQARQDLIEKRIYPDLTETQRLNIAVMDKVVANFMSRVHREDIAAELAVEPLTEKEREKLLEQNPKVVLHPQALKPVELKFRSLKTLVRVPNKILKDSIEPLPESAKGVVKNFRPILDGRDDELKDPPSESKVNFREFL